MVSWWVFQLAASLSWEVVPTHLLVGNGVPEQVKRRDKHRKPNLLLQCHVQDQVQ